MNKFIINLFIFIIYLTNMIFANENSIIQSCQNTKLSPISNVKILDFNTSIIDLDQLLRKYLNGHEYLKNKIESKVLLLHKNLSVNAITEINHVLKKIEKNPDATIIELYEVMKKHTILQLLSNVRRGNNIDTELHNRRVVEGMDKLSANDYKYFNQRRDKDEHISKSAFQKLFLIDKEQRTTSEGRVIRALVTVLHDYGKILGFPNHPENGSKLVKSLLDKLSLSNKIKSQIIQHIKHHVIVFAIASGEGSIKKAEKYFRNSNISLSQMLKYQLPLNIIDAFAFKDKKGVIDSLKFSLLIDLVENLKIYLYNSKEVLFQQRIGRIFHYENFQEYADNVNMMDTFPDVIIKDINDISIDTNFSYKEFIDFIINIDFSYTLYILSEKTTKIDNQYFMKILFVLFTIYKKTSFDISKISFFTDKEIQGLIDFISQYNTIKKISTFMAKLQKKENVDDIIQITSNFVIKVKNENLIIYPNYTVPFLESTHNKHQIIKST